MVAVLTAEIKRSDYTWPWFQQVTLPIPERIKVIKRMGITGFWTGDDSNRGVYEAGKLEPRLAADITTGAVSIYLNDYKVGEQLVIDCVSSSRISLTHMLTKVNRAVKLGDKITLTPISPSILFNGFDITVKVYIEY